MGKAILLFSHFAISPFRDFAIFSYFCQNNLSWDRRYCFVPQTLDLNR